MCDVRFHYLVVAFVLQKNCLPTITLMEKLQIFLHKLQTSKVGDFYDSTDSFSNGCNIPEYCSHV